MARRSRVDAKTVAKKRTRLKLATKVQLLSIDRRSSEHVKRSRAECLVRRLLAVQVAAYVYQRLAVRPTDAQTRPATRTELRYRAYIPTQMPPGEVAGLRFDDPVKRPVAPRVMFLNRSERAQQFNV